MEITDISKKLTLKNNLYSFSILSVLVVNYFRMGTLTELKDIQVVFQIAKANSKPENEINQFWLSWTVKCEKLSKEKLEDMSTNQGTTRLDFSL